MRKLLFDNSLEFEVNVIGYKGIGECILFFIKTNHKVAYAGLVDCYKTKNCDIVKLLMDSENVERLDFVCWTHPHDDHTKGLEEMIEKFCDSATIFWATDILPENYSLYSEESKIVYKKLKEIHLSDDPEKININYAKNATTMERLICRGLNNYVFEIKSFSPDSTMLAERQVRDQDEEGNLYSIGLLINIGRYYIMLAGDVENPVIETIKDFNIEYPVDYIKIPHHGSPSASFLVDRLRGLDIFAPNIATTTLYRIHGIPKRAVLDKYRAWGTEAIYSTGDVDNKENDTLPYGIIKTTFDILEQKEYPIETELIGNAVPVN